MSHAHERQVQILFCGSIFRVDYHHLQSSPFGTAALTVGWFSSSLENKPPWGRKSPLINEARCSALGSPGINLNWMSDHTLKKKMFSSHTGGIWDFCPQGKEKFHLRMSLKNKLEWSYRLTYVLRASLISSSRKFHLTPASFLESFTLFLLSFKSGGQMFSLSGVSNPIWGHTEIFLTLNLFK